MTEAEWLACEEPQEMLRLLCESASHRKLRLVACGCCRLVWPELAVKRSSRAVELAEKYADGNCPRQEMIRAGERARSASRSASRTASQRDKPDYLLHDACGAAAYANAHHAANAATQALQLATEGTKRNQAQSELIRCVFGTGLGSVAVDRGRIGPLVKGLAQAAYDERLPSTGLLDPARLAVLSDALEEAGCTDDALLSHIRSPGLHVRGCWVLDLILGKS